MFTGIIQTLGKRRSSALPHTLLISAPLSFFEEDYSQLNQNNQKELPNRHSPEPGESIAVNGVCLTLENFQQDITHSEDLDQEKSILLQFHLGPETLNITDLVNMGKTEPVHLERSLRVGQRISGHFVYGHVDGIGQICRLAQQDESFQFEVKVPAELTRFCVKKGSVAIDGVSLTINEVLPGGIIQIILIPHTWKHTRFSYLKEGSPVHIEVDMLARYALSNATGNTEN